MDSVVWEGLNGVIDLDVDGHVAYLTSRRGWEESVWRSWNHLPMVKRWWWLLGSQVVVSEVVVFQKARMRPWKYFDEGRLMRLEGLSVSQYLQAIHETI